MAEFALPKNSKIHAGRRFAAPAGATRTRFAPAGAGKCLPFWTFECFGRVNSAMARPQ